jgi:hypothetical protein
MMTAENVKGGEGAGSKGGRGDGIVGMTGERERKREGVGEI